MAAALCRSWKSIEVDGRLQIPRHLETQGGLSSIAFKSSGFFSPNFVETRKGNGFAQLCRRHFLFSFGNEEWRAAALEPQMATPGAQAPAHLKIQLGTVYLFLLLYYLIGTCSMDMARPGSFVCPVCHA